MQRGVEGELQHEEEVAAVEAFGICAFCAPVTYCDDFCFEDICMDGEDCDVKELQLRVMSGLLSIAGDRGGC